MSNKGFSKSNDPDSICLIDGIQVKFPYKPYNVQKSYMESVIKAFKNGKNALLESPTGTGKTLSLVCSTLACIIDHKAKRKEEAQNPDSENLKGIEMIKNQFEPDVKKGKAQSLSKISIIYTSRTHSQLKQVVSEIKKTEYSKEFKPKGLKGVVLASRDLLCVNPFKGNMYGEQLNSFCRVLVQGRKCQYHNNFKHSSNPEEFHFNELLDIEDMVKLGKENSFCPYFSAKDTQEKADLILIPYNYLLSRNIRELMEINIKNSVVIIDEAHNVESVAEESSSFQIKQTDIAKFIDSLQRLARFHKDYINTNGTTVIDGIEMQFTKLTKVGLCLKKIDDFMTELTLPDMFQVKQQVKFKDIVGEGWVIKDINRQHLVHSAYQFLNYVYEELEFKNLIGEKIEDTLCSVVTVLTKGVMDGDTLEPSFQAHYDGKSLRDDINTFVLLKKTIRSLLNFELADSPQYYNVIITNDEKYENNKKSKTSWQGYGSERNEFGWQKKLKRDNEVSYEYEGAESVEMDSVRSWDVTPKVISFVCLMPVPTFASIVREGVRSIIMTSGTLGPLDAMEKNVGGDNIKFEIKLRNEHVIDPSRVWAGALTGDSSNPYVLSSTFENRRKTEYVEALGKSLLSFVKCVPSGVLVFFGSYFLMNYTLDCWRRMGLYSKLEMIKSVYVETRSTKSSKDDEIVSEDTLTLFQRYKKSIDNGKGAIFFAICRGRMAEGIDFSDNYCRGIFVCGIPYPSRYDDATALKMDYLDKLSLQSPEKVNLANEWYKSQAIKAINQAAGRSIRHVQDYGAILLADHRFKLQHIKSNISKWVNNKLVIYSKVEDCVPDITSFFSKFDATKHVKTQPQQNIQPKFKDTKIKELHATDNKIKQNKLEEPISPTRIDPKLEFRSRDTTKNIKTMPVYLNTPPNKLQREYGNSILNYLEWVKKVPEPKSKSPKDEGFSFKSLDKWSF